MNPATWVVSTLAGSREGYVDGECKSSLFRCPSAFAFSPQGFVYLADRSNNSIRKLDLKERTVKTVDRTGLSQPTSIAWSPEGFFLVADRNNHKIKMFKIDEGILQHFSGSDSGYADGAKDVCRFSNPSSLVSTIDGQVYVSDLGNDRIRLLSRDGAATTYAGSHGGFADGPRTKALFSKPWGLFLSSYSELFICDWGNNRIRMIDNHGVVSTIAGTGNTGSTDGLGNVATFNCPISLVLTPQNDILVADRNNHKIRYIKKLSTGWEVSTFAGSTNGLVDGKCSVEAKFTQPTALAWTPSGQLLISSNDCIRMIEEVASGPRETDSALSTSFDVLFNAPFSDFSFLSHSGQQFALHRPILLSRCDALANQSIWRSLEALTIPTESWQHFWNFLYIDQLPSTDVPVAQKLEVAKEYCDLHLISHICSMKILSDHCKHTIKSLVVGNIDSISELLSVVTSRNIEPNHPLFYMLLDLISANLNGDKHKTVATVGQLLSSKLSFQESALERITSHPQFTESQSRLHNATGSLYVHLSRLCSITPDSMQNLASSSRPTDPLVPYDYAIRIDDTIIECHKCILYARWPYFRTMMNAGLSEAIHGEAQFSSSPDDGFTVEAMKALLWFFYSDSPSLFTYETGIEVMTGAGRFGFVDFSTNAPNPGFEELTRFCSIPLHVTPSVQNSVSLHKIAMRVGDGERTKTTRTTIIASLPAIFLDSKLKAEFESLDIEEKYSLLQDAFSRLVEAPKDR